MGALGDTREKMGGWGDILIEIDFRKLNFEDSGILILIFPFGYYSKDRIPKPPMNMWPYDRFFNEITQYK